MRGRRYEPHHEGEVLALEARLRMVKMRFRAVKNSSEWFESFFLRQATKGYG